MSAMAPTLTTCDLCNRRMAAMRGPYSRNIGRPAPPAGFVRGYIVEVRDREFPICADCVDHIVHPAA